ICVGMQALFESSEENGIHPGLGVLPGKVEKFAEFDNLKIPHTGWNQLWINQNNPLMSNIKSGNYVYFNHSFYCSPTQTNDITATTDYGIDFCSVVRKENLFGVQFHPEKSQNTGKQILSNFINIGRNNS
ncbi:MAG TPA: imidazole glycerol phosphate synthase subunit HisH, partial [Anaerolineaceae bacterium]|nr:imidazole glycerol phosphate synthase subunit HisH [Anaerolineaceae bacterium]